jgi:hypothetical protein
MRCEVFNRVALQQQLRVVLKNVCLRWIDDSPDFLDPSNLVSEVLAATLEQLGGRLEKFVCIALTRRPVKPKIDVGQNEPIPLRSAEVDNLYHHGYRVHP